jgi:uncharacterized delta-60 repeat protein
MTVDFTFEGYPYDRGVARAVLVDALGRLLVVGDLRNTVTGLGMAFVTRLNPDGTIDHGWRYNGIAGGWYFSSFLERVATAALDRAGNIWILGPEIVNGTGGWSFIRLSAAGNEIATETIPVVSGYDVTVPTALLFQPSGQPVIGGWGQQQGPPVYATPLIVRLLGDGTGAVPDSNFGFRNDGWLILDYSTAARLQSMALLPNGGLVIAGEAGPPGAEDVVVQRLAANGVADGTFETYVAFDVGGSGSDGSGGFVRMVAQSDGKVVVAARVLTGDPANKSDIGVARLLPNNDLDATFGGNGTGKRVFTLSNPPPGASDDRLGCLVFAAGRPIVGGSGEYMGLDSDFAFRRLTNAHIFSDGFESGSAFFWSGATP